MVTILQYTHMFNHCILHLKPTYVNVNNILIKLEKESWAAFFGLDSPSREAVNPIPGTPIQNCLKAINNEVQGEHQLLHISQLFPNNRSILTATQDCFKLLAQKLAENQFLHVWVRSHSPSGHCSQDYNRPQEPAFLFLQIYWPT